MTLAANAITAGYRDDTVLHDATLTLHQGELLGIIGPNGCGKSTLLRCLAALHKPTAGDITLHNTPVRAMPARARARALAVLPQTTIAPPGLTVADLVAFGRAPHRDRFRSPDAADRDAIARALQQADLETLATRPLSELSGGERQRAWVAMTLAQDTPFVLLDEPTAALDIGHALDLLALIARQTHPCDTGAPGKGVAVVLHDLNLAAAHCDRIVALHNGRVIADGPPDAVLTQELVRTLYAVDADIETDQQTGRPHMRFPPRRPAANPSK